MATASITREIEEGLVICKDHFFLDAKCWDCLHRHAFNFKPDLLRVLKWCTRICGDVYNLHTIRNLFKANGTIKVLNLLYGHTEPSSNTVSRA